MANPGVPGTPVVEGVVTFGVAMAACIEDVGI
jgi:hypothetical protein